MPPKSKRQKKNERVVVAHEPDPDETKLCDGDHTTIDDFHTKKDRVTLTDSNAFDALHSLQTHTKSGATPKSKDMPVFYLNAASVANAAAITHQVTSPPVLTMPKQAMIPSRIVLPDLAISSSLSTLSRPPETPKQCIQLTNTSSTQHRNSMVAPRPAGAQYNLSMTSFTDTTLRSIIKNCIKDHIFRKCKFYHRDKHGMYDTSPMSMCGQIMKHCSLKADATWWYQMRMVVVKTHTDHRNNCIKRLNARFKGTEVTCAQTCVQSHLTNVNMLLCV